MGGSGGGSYFRGRQDPDELARRVREAEDEAGRTEHEAAVARVMADALAQYNDRDAEGIRDALEDIKAELADEIEGTVDLVFGGSVARHTYVDGMSDVDALVLLSGIDPNETTPETVRSSFAERLRARYGRDSVYEGTLAVTVRVGEHEIQLLPAVRSGRAFQIANEDASGWSTIRPRAFARELTRLNSRLNGNLTPTIKLAKVVINALPEQRRLKSYHTENLAVRVFQEYNGSATPKAMLTHFFEHAGEAVRTRIQDRTGQSRYVDDYLGKSGSLARRIVADALDRIGRKMRNADGARSVEQWRQLVSPDE